MFLFFMITDPRTIPDSAVGRRAYAVGVGLLATVLIAPLTTEFGTKVAILAALFVVCADARRDRAGRLDAAPSSRLSRRPRRRRRRDRRARGRARLCRPRRRRRHPGATGLGRECSIRGQSRRFPRSPWSNRRASRESTSATAQTHRAGRPRRSPRRVRRACAAATSIWPRRAPAAPGSQRSGTDPRDVGSRSSWPTTTSSGWSSACSRGANQGPPTVVARLEGTLVPVDLRPGARTSLAAASPRLSAGRCELALEDGRYLIVRSQGGLPLASEPALAPRAGGTLGGTSLENVARQSAWTSARVRSASASRTTRRP